MTRKEQLLGRLAQKEQVTLSKTAATYRDLHQSHADMEAQSQRIQSMIDEKKDTISTATSKYELQTNHLMCAQLTSQLSMAESKVEYLSRELNHARKNMAQQEHKVATVLDRKDEERRKNS